MKRSAEIQAQPGTSKFTYNPAPRPLSPNMETTTTTTTLQVGINHDTTDNAPQINLPTRLGSTDMPKFKTLEKLTLGLARATNHKRFLRECLDQGMTPKGLQIIKEPQIPHVDPSFILEWSLIIEEAQNKLVISLINFWTSHATFLETEITKAYIVCHLQRKHGHSSLGPNKNQTE